MAWKVALLDHKVAAVVVWGLFASLCCFPPQVLPTDVCAWANAFGALVNVKIPADGMAVFVEKFCLADL